MKACDASLLAAYRIALVHGVVEREVIAELIDQMLIATESPPAELLAAADAHRTSITEIASALTRLTAGADTSRTARLFMGLARAALLERPDLAEDVAHALYRMACDHVVPSVEAEHTMFGLEDLFALAASGSWGSREESLADLEEFLAAHGEPPGS